MQKANAGAAGVPVTLAMAGASWLVASGPNWVDPILSSTRVPADYSAPTTLVLLNTQGKKEEGVKMKTSLNFRVEAANDDVVVTLDGTKCMVRYVKADTGLNLFHARGDERSPIHDIHFLARARQLANAKAKELGWIV